MAVEKIIERSNQAIRELEIYTPGKPISEVARAHGLRKEEIVKLASNENPLGAAPSALEFLSKNAASIYRYPDASAFYLRQALARKWSIRAEQILFGAGSNEIIEIIAQAFLGTGDEIVVGRNAFAIYRICARMFGAKVVEVTDNDDFSHDLDAILAAINNRTKIVFLANPNNPTGTYHAHEKIVNFMRNLPSDILFVLDEAYYEYLENAPPSLELLPDFPNLIILRTFSKIYGLASLRIGWSASDAKLCQLLNQARQPFNVNGLALGAAQAALDDTDFIEKSRLNNEESRAHFAKLLRRIGVNFIPSLGNFMLIDCAKIGGGQNAAQELLKRGFITRAMAGHHLPNWLRVSIGSKIEMSNFVAAFAKL